MNPSTENFFIENINDYDVTLVHSYDYSVKPNIEDESGSKAHMNERIFFYRPIKLEEKMTIYFLDMDEGDTLITSPIRIYKIKDDKLIVKTENAYYAFQMKHPNNN